MASLGESPEDQHRGSRAEQDLDPADDFAWIPIPSSDAPPFRRPRTEAAGGDWIPADSIKALPAALTVSPWGTRPTPLLPAALRNAFPRDRVPEPLDRFFGGGISVGSLDAAVWARTEVHSLPGELLSEVIRLFELRFDGIASLPAFRRPADSDVARAPLSTRARNAVRRGGFTRAAGAGVVVFNDIASLPSVGMKTVLELSCVLEALDVSLGAAAEPTLSEVSEAEIAELQALLTVVEQASEFDVTTVGRLIECVQEIAAWASREMNLVSLGDVFSVAPASWPTELRSMRDEVRRMELGALAGSRALQYSVPQLTADLLASFDERQRLVLQERVFRQSRGPTLEELGDRLGVTRERVRQVQVKAERLLRDGVAKRQFLPVQRRALRLREELGAAIPRRALPDVLQRARSDFAISLQATASELFLWLAGPYREQAGWIVREESQELLSAAAAAINEAADENGAIPAEELTRILGSLEVREEFQHEWSEQFGEVRRTPYGLLRWDGNTLDRLERMLLARGAPATAEELLAECGLDRSERGIRQRLLEDPRFVRINRQCDFAHRRWDYDEYSGIADEIAEEIERSGGSALAQRLIDDISSRFGVARASVNTYLSAPMFVIEGSTVRLRRVGEPFVVTGTFAACRGAYRSADDVVSLLISIDQEILRGSGRAIPGPVAEALGVAPDSPRSFNTATGPLTITWPVTAAFGATLGSTRSLALSVGASEGDQLRIDFDLAAGRASGERVPAMVDGYGSDEILRLLTGVKADDAESRLADALGVPLGEVRRRLVERGDGIVVSVLPEKSADPALESALSALAQLLDELA